MEIKDTKWSENIVTDHLSRLTLSDELLEHKKHEKIIDSFPHEHLFEIGSLP